MGYYIDLSKISIDDYKEKLKTSEFIPSRMILKESLDERFNYFGNIGISNVKELQQALKNKSKFSELAKISCFNEEYLAILLREINSLNPKPNKFREFTYLSPEIIDKLEKLRIRDTADLFEKVKKTENRNELSNKSGIRITQIVELTKLADLSRIKWVGATFAWVLFLSGFDTVEKVTKANYEELHRKITELNKEKNIYKGHIGLKDMKLLVAAAKEVPIEIEY